MRDDALKQQVRDLLERGEKINAIRLYREATGGGLTEAKQAVEAIERDAGGEIIPSLLDDAFLESLLDLLKKGQKIEAIKRYRERTGAGLKEAKDTVEDFGRRAGVPDSGSKISCGSAALVLAGMATAGAWLLLQFVF
jgi:ribosomal protein L7/L12